MASTKSKQDALIDELLKDCADPKDILGKNGLLKQLTKRLVERTLKAELTDHLGYEPHAPEGHGSGNNRNGKSQKTVQSESGPLQIEVPRDRNGTFEPQFIKKRQRRLEGFDDKVLALYARGLSTRDIQGQLEEIYGVEVSPTLISNVTDAVMDDMRAWQSRAVSAVYPILYFDALFVKTRQEGPVMTKAIYLALGINLEGEKELLGLGCPDGRLEVLANGIQRSQELWPSGLLYRLRGWAQGIARSDRGGLSPHPGAAVHRSQAAQLVQIRTVEGAQGSRHGPAGRICCSDTGGSRAGACAFLRALGCEVSRHQSQLAG